MKERQAAAMGEGASPRRPAGRVSWLQNARWSGGGAGERALRRQISAQTRRFARVR